MWQERRGKKGGTEMMEMAASVLPFPVPKRIWGWWALGPWACNVTPLCLVSLPFGYHACPLCLAPGVGVATVPCFIFANVTPPFTNFRIWDSYFSTLNLTFSSIKGEKTTNSLIGLLSGQARWRAGQCLTTRSGMGHCWWVMFANVRDTNIPATADVKLPMYHLWTWN